MPPELLIAVDLDGTLLGPDDRVSAANVDAVARARSLGVAVIPVTGRPDRLVWHVAGEAALGPLGVCVNGAVLIDLETRRVLVERGFDGPDALAVVDAMRTAVPGVVLGADHEDGFVHEPGLLAALDLPERSTRRAVDDLRPVVAGGCIKFVARRDDLTSVELAARLAVALGGGATDTPATPAEELAVLTASDVGWVDIGPAGFTKGTGLLAVCDRLGIDPRSTAAVGDHFNDLPMLVAAGRSAAMGNAIPEVIEAADVVVPANDADGVAVYIHGLLDELVG